MLLTMFTPSEVLKTEIKNYDFITWVPTKFTPIRNTDALIIAEEMRITFSV